MLQNEFEEAENSNFNFYNININNPNVWIWSDGFERLKIYNFFQKLNYLLLKHNFNSSSNIHKPN